MTEDPSIKVMPDGPYRVTGAGLVRMRRVLDGEGDAVEWERWAEVDHPGTYDLCRCGASGAKPFCDGSETEAAFDGTETADRGPTDARRGVYGDGPVVLTDDVSFCTHAEFCVRGRLGVWELAEQTEDPEARELMVRMVQRCPSGRLDYRVPPELVPVEQDLPREIAVTDDGPLWVRGGIAIESADGFTYEVRNRVALCRCGRSGNKPFCDGSHSRAKFRDPEPGNNDPGEPLAGP